MLDDEDLAIIAWTRRQILAGDELADMVPDGPWAVDDDAHAVISADTGTVQPTGVPQVIKPVRPGLLTEPVFETFDPPGRPPVTAMYLLAAADPWFFRDGQRSRLATLELCHRLLAGAARDEMARAVAQRFLRLLAAVYRHWPGYDPAWEPDLAPFPLPQPQGRASRI